MNTETLLKAVQNYLESETACGNSKFIEADRNLLYQQVSEARKELAVGEACACSIDHTTGRIFKRIMVALDNSEQSGFAGRLAARLAMELGCDLSLIHVVHIPPMVNPDLAFEQIEMHPAMLEGGQSLLDRTAKRLAAFAPIEQVLREGDPATEIADAATRLGADLIVLGTHGRGRFASAVVGSVAQGVMRKATCPVLCIAHDPMEPRAVARIAAPVQADYFPVTNA